MSEAGDRRWHYRRSLASRVALLTTIVVGLSVASVSAATFAVVRQQLQSSMDASLLNRAHKAAVGGAIAEITAVPSWVIGAADVRIAVIYADKQPRYSLDDGPSFRVGGPELAVANGSRETVVRTVRASDGTRWRVVTVQAGEDQALMLAQSLEPQDRVLRNLGSVTLLFFLLGVLAAGIAGWQVARHGLRPVRRLTASVEDIARTEDLTPLPVEGADELARLSAAFNRMLTALSASRDRQRQLVADAGHELRTPLTSLRTNLDLLSQAEGGELAIPAAARAELLADVRAQIEEMTTLIGDLVELARDEPLREAVVEEVDIGEVLDRALARVKRRAPLLAFDVTSSPWIVHGEESSLERAFTNLLDNAAKWSPPGGIVTVALHDGVLTVDDQGPGISPQDLPHIFDRFYRSAESRTMPGSGLGLSIVRQIAERHSGSVVAGASPSGGARLVLRLPGSRVELGVPGR
ncbi:MAG: HAMP domain-containing sensor histidine kinase [Nocardioides sp.]|jgi:two-component system sensor histidine kinase MprB